MNFRVGQKVVRVNSNAGPEAIKKPPGVHISTPEIGEVVTIRTINHWPNYTLLTFVEHDNSHMVGTVPGFTREGGFNAAAFRPVVERKTDISIFTKMLDDAKHPVGAA